MAPELKAEGCCVFALNYGGYAVIQTVFDNVVTPFTHAFLTGPGVKNIVLQRECPLDQSDHLSISYSRHAIRLVTNALAPSTARRLCVCAPPLIG